MRPQVSLATTITIPVIFMVLLGFASHVVGECRSKTATPSQPTTHVDAGQGQ